MIKEVRIKLSDTTYNSLQEEATQRGLKVNELVKWLIGDYTKYWNPQPPRIMALPSMPPVQPMMDKLSRMTNLVVNQLSVQGMLKCPDCTMPLNSEALESGICNNCGYKI